MLTVRPVSLSPYPPWSCTGTGSIDYSPSIRNSSGKDSEYAASPVSSIPTNNELDRCKSSSGSLSPDQILNEDPPISASGPSSQDEHSYHHNNPTVYMGSNAPSRRPGGDSEPTQPFPAGLPVGPGQTDTTSDDTALVSFFCHACGLFIQGERSEALEMLVQHRCTKPIDGGHVGPSEHLPPNHSHSKRVPLYAESYPRPNLTRARPGLGMSLTTAPRGYASSYYDGHPQSLVSFASFKQLMLEASRQSFQDTYPERRPQFELRGDIDDMSGPNLPADAMQDTNRHSYLNPNTRFNYQPLTLDWPRQKVDDFSASNTVVNDVKPQPVNATYDTMTSAHPFHEREISASQAGPRFGSTPAIPPYEFVSGQTWDPDVVATGTTDWPQTGHSDSAYPPRPNPPVHHGYPPYTARSGPHFDTSPSRFLLISNVPKSITNEGIDDAFAPCGAYKSIWTGHVQSLGIVILVFHDLRHAENACRAIRSSTTLMTLGGVRRAVQLDSVFISVAEARDLTGSPSPVTEIEDEAAFLIQIKDHSTQPSTVRSVLDRFGALLAFREWHVHSEDGQWFYVEYYDVRETQVAFHDLHDQPHVLGTQFSLYTTKLPSPSQ